MKRPEFKTRKFLLRGEQQRQLLANALQHLPLDETHPLEVVIREEVKARTLDQNAAMWSGPLRDISEQAYVDGRSFSADAWNYHFKVLFLPEEFDPAQCKEGYCKWDYTPSGERVLVGSTTQLTVRGFAIYLQQVEAYGANLGVLFHANPRQTGRQA